MNTNIKKVLLAAGGIVLTVAAFCFVPKINKRLADKLYQKIR